MTQPLGAESPPKRGQKTGQDTGPRLQFSLASLLLADSLICLALATVPVLGATTALALGFLGLCVAAHIAGNSIGTRLRTRGTTSAGPRLHEPAPRRGQVRSHEYAPATMLRSRNALGRTLAAFTAAGFLTGAATGVVVILVFARQPISLAGLTLGSLSFAILGGFGAYMTGSFVQVFREAAGQAARDASEKSR